MSSSSSSSQQRPQRSSSVRPTTPPMPAMQTAIYQPLDVSKKQIRLLTIEPSTDEAGKIRAFLETMKLPEDATEDERNDGSPEESSSSELGVLSKTAPFEALSYVWGDASNTHQIELEGRLFTVRENLYSALRWLRKSTPSRRIWIDAICVNQEDIPERNSQVALMFAIFRQASRVVVWLGHAPDDPGIQSGLRWLQDNCALAQPLKYDENESSPSGKNYIPWEVANASLEILFNVWWTRVWTLQELVLASDPVLVCAPYEIIFDTLVWFKPSFKRGYERSWEFDMDNQDNYRARMQQRRDSLMLELELMLVRRGVGYTIQHRVHLGLSADGRTRRSRNVPWLSREQMSKWAEEEEGLGSTWMWVTDGSRTLTSLLQINDYRRATDKRDSVFALLNLVPGTNMIPDYSREAALVFREVMITVFQDSNSLGHLLFVPSSRVFAKRAWQGTQYIVGEDIMGLPSWCVNFAAVCWYNYAPSALKYACASEGDTRPNGRCIVDPDKCFRRLDSGEIKLPGYRIGIVKTAITLVDLDTVPTEFRDITASIMRAQSATPEGTDRVEAAVEATLRVFGAGASHKYEDLLNVCLKIMKGSDAGYWQTDSDLSKIVPWIASDFDRLVPKILEADSRIRNNIYSYSSDFPGIAFATHGGDFGSARCLPIAQIRPGDTICVLDGCSWPLVLRRRESGTHTLVTSAYVDQIMEYTRDELYATLEMSRVEKYPREDFVLV